jgi:hypothetical protein
MTNNNLDNNSQRNDDNQDYFGKDNTQEGYLNFFMNYASDHGITPHSYASFSLNKLRNINNNTQLFRVDISLILLTNEQQTNLNNLIQDPSSTFEDLCSIFTPYQFQFIGW